MRIIFAGTPDNAARTLKSLYDSGIEIALVITREDAKFGRKATLTESAVAAMARELGLKVHKANRIDENAASAIRNAMADFAVIVAFGVILKQNIIDLLPRGWFNVHYSLLPAYRGAAPVQHALLNSEATTGVSIFKIDSGLDTGSLVAQVETTIEPGENAKILLNRLTTLSFSLLIEQLPLIESGLNKLEAQSSSGVSFAPKLERAQFKLTVADPASVNESKVLAANPEPMAYLDANGHSVAICDATAVRSSELASALQEMNTQGSGVLTVDGLHILKRGKCVYLQCASDTWLELIEVQPASKRVMSALDWFNGLKNESSRA